MADPKARTVDVRVYLEGVRIPVRSVSVTGSENNHIQANIDIPPTPLSTSLKPRTLVHVVYKTSSDATYKLLFDGELVGITAAEDTQNKSTVLVCAGLTNYWEYVWLYFLNKISPSAYSDTETAAFASGVSPEARTQFSGITFAVPQPLLANIVLSSFILAGSDVQRALLNVIFLMANTSEGAVGNIEKPRLNQFLEKAFRNLRLGERVFVLPDDEIKRLIDFNLSQALLNKAMGDLGNFSSLTELINRFLGMVYYNWVPLLAPSYTRRNTDKSLVLDFFNPLDFKSSGGDGSLTPTTSSIASAKNLDSKNVLRSVVFKPKTYFLPPPTCNFLFPSMFDHFASTRMFLQEPTRLRVQVHPIPAINSDINTWNTASFYAPTELGKIIRDTERIGGLQQQSSQASGTDTTQAVSAEEALAARSKEQDPSPDEAPTLRYEKLIQQTGSGEIDETVTGVIPAFEDLGWAEYATLALDGNKANEAPKSTVEDTEVTVKQEVPKINTRQDTNSENIPLSTNKYLTNIAQYKLDTRRHAPRSLQGVRGPYNPNLAVGFPGIVFTKRAIFVGEMSSVTHNLNAGGQVYTATSLTMARELSMIPGLFKASPVELEIIDEALRKLAISIADASGGEATFEAFKKFVDAEFKARSAKYNNLGTDLIRLKLLITGFDPTDRIPVQPEWLSSRYRPKNIGLAVYRDLFGDNVRSLLEVIDNSFNITIVTENMVIAANLFLIRYLLAPDKVAFVDRLTSRKIATAAEAMTDFLGFATPSAETTDRQKIFSSDNLSVFSDLTSEATTDKTLVQETIEAPDLPVNPVRLKAVNNYVEFLTGVKGKAFRG